MSDETTPPPERPLDPRERPLDPPERRVDPSWTGSVVRPDGRSLRALAHPLRLRLLGLLRMDGAATASQLAARTGQSSGATSYHLRQLAAYGFVIEEPD